MRENQVIFRNAKQVQGNLKKLAFVLDEDGELEEMYDAPDSKYSGKDIERFSLLLVEPFQLRTETQTSGHKIYASLINNR